MGRHLNSERRRVLVVDDQSSVREIARRTLEAYDFLVDEAPNGLEALRCLEQRQPDLILLDLMMPELDGFGVVEQLGANAEWADIPVVVLTAKELTMAELHSLQRSARSILQKGSSTEEILAEITKAIEGA